MKKLLFILIFLPFIGFGQAITFKELISMSKMDYESFEIYTVERGYELWMFRNGNMWMKWEKDGLYRSLSKDNGIREKFSITTHSGTDTIPKINLRKCIDYKTELGGTELLGFLTELKNLNYTLTERINTSNEVRQYLKRYESSDKKSIVWLEIKGKWLNVHYGIK